MLGVDLNVEALAVARELAQRIADESERPLPVEFAEMDAHALDLPDASFDVVVADNLFEHVDDPGRVLAESARVLRSGGRLLVPQFSSIRSKYGLHLKHGLRLPWINALFSERTIVSALGLQAKRRPELFDVYPGLRDRPERVRDVRRHRDLNDITHREFLRLAREADLEVVSFRVKATPVGRVLRRLAPRLELSSPLDLLSTGAAAILVRE